MLVVEDDVQLQNTYQDRLSQEGFKVVASDSVSTGLNQIKSLRPNLVVLDIMLPGGQNGFDFLEQIKLDSELKDTPVLVITNLDHQRDIALSIGAIDCLLKTDVDLETVVSKIKSYL